MTNLTQPAAGVSPQRDFDFSALLNSLDGLSYVVAADGTILAVGEPAWSDFAVANDAPAIHGSLMVGRDLFDGTTDDNVRALQRRLHQAVLDRHSPVIAYD